MHDKLKRHREHDRHEFAFFVRTLPASLAVGTSYKIGDADVAHRMVYVVRIEEDDTAVLFGLKHVATVRIATVKKSVILCTVLAFRPIERLAPSVSWYLPLLDREAFEESVSILTSMGATDITPIITEKSESRLRSIERIERVMIAAAEQSKQFALPIVHPVVSLLESDACTQTNRIKTLFFDPAGTNAYDVMTEIRATAGKPLACIIGPEGDLTVAEKERLRASGVFFCALTPTILRAEQAVTVAMGLIRSCGTSAA